MQRQNQKGEGPLPAGNGEAIRRLAASGDAQQLVAMLRAKGGVQQAAQAAAQGDASSLVEMVNQLMHTPEGAKLVERINQKAKESGLG